jgi:hypothetical protein
MTVALIFAAILPIFAIFCALWLTKRWLENKEAEFRGEFNAWLAEYLNPPAEGQPSKFGILVDAMATIFASRLMTSLRAQLNNLSSLATRQEKALEGEAIGAALPGIAASIPGIGRMIQKNPLLGLAAQYLMSQKSNKNEGGQPAVASNGHDVFKL